MDPTKPILNIQGSNSGCFYRDVCVKPVEKITFEDKYQQLQYERNFYKDQYQRLYQAYQELKLKLQNSQQLKSYVVQLQSKISMLENQSRGGGNLQEVRILKQKNQQLSETILNKNYELEDAYRRIQESGKRSTSFNSGMNRKVLASVDKLQDGIKEAIFSNFQLLKNNSIGQLKNLIRNPVGQSINYSSEISRGYSTTPGYVINQQVMRNTNPGYQSGYIPRY